MTPGGLSKVFNGGIRIGGCGDPGHRGADRDDHTPLDWAQWRGQTEVAEFLRSEMHKG